MIEVLYDLYKNYAYSRSCGKNLSDGIVIRYGDVVDGILFPINTIPDTLIVRIKELYEKVHTYSIDKSELTPYKTEYMLWQPKNF